MLRLTKVSHTIKDKGGVFEALLHSFFFVQFVQKRRDASRQPFSNQTSLTPNSLLWRNIRGVVCPKRATRALRKLRGSSTTPPAVPTAAPTATPGGGSSTPPTAAPTKAPTKAPAGESGESDTDKVTDTGSLKVVVTDEATGEKLSGVPVQIKDPDGKKKSYKTDKNGELFLENI